MPRKTHPTAEQALKFGVILVAILLFASTAFVAGVGAVGDVPPEEADGPELLIETNIDNDHACTHDEADNRTALDAGDSPEDAPVVTDDHVIWNVTTDGGEGYVQFDNTEHDIYPGLDSWVFYYADADLEPTDGEVLETGDVPECDLDSYAEVETPEDGVFNLQLTSDEHDDGDDAAGEISVQDDINADDESVDVTTSDYTELTDGVVLVEDDQGNEETYDSVGEGETLTVDIGDAGLDLNAGEDVTVTLYESDTLENELDTDSTTVDEAVGDEIEEFEIVDRSTDEVAAYVHGDHWHGELPHVDEGEHISLGANIETADGEEIDLSGDEYSLGVELADGAEDGVVSFDEHGDHVHIAGEEEGHTDVVFQLVHDDHVDYETPAMDVEVEHHDHDDGEIEEFEIVDRSTDEVAAYVHGDHWHGELPHVDEGEHISLGANIETADGEEIDLSGEEYSLGVELADGAEDGVLSVDEHGDHVHIEGESEGHTDVVFQLVHDDHVDYETPAIEVAVSEDDHAGTGIGTFELIDADTDDVVADVHDDHWHGELPELYGGEPVELDVSAEDADGNEIDIGDEYELDVALADESDEELVSINERGDSVLLSGAGDGHADLVFQLHHDDHLEYETPAITAQVDVPAGVKFLGEADVDHDHACFHGDFDERTPLDSAEAPADAPVVDDTHVIWNVTYADSAGYVSFDADGHWYDGPFVFYTADGSADPVEADVLERGTVDNCATLDEYMVVETPDDGTIDFQISADTTANETTAGHDFAGIVSDDEPLPVTADGLTDADGNEITDGSATIQLTRNGSVLASTTGVTIEDGEISDATIDTEAIADDVESGPATVEIAGVETETEAQVELVHEVHTLENEFTTKSLPQPAALHTESIDTIDRWDTANQSYVSLGAQYGDGDIIANPDDLHRGLYIGAADDARLGYEFETDSRPAPSDAQLSNGWHLASSNFAVGEDDGTRTLDEDLVNIDPAAAGVTVFDDQQRTQLDPSASIAGFDTYWVYVDDPERTDRGIVGPNYDPVERSAILDGTDE
ncbi:hypothetical protein RBH26_07595 [Natronolimnohabitans sp. A-GB9]|uniref:hypothetical protein n=1 Tax=Natronolimnohabitans sp. A-GB9 TaxID=3069757 RepID=UPI0027B30DA0|nr:hypothetical protein [Natronolimnohabitans sp. A-GB9]MDQ2050347.1 hypothetical protein [Natronolimnohabitans sp. A-GB9]